MKQFLKHEKVRVGVIGMGRQGRIHSQNLSFRIPDAELVCVSEINLSSATESLKSLNISGIEIYEDYRKILDRIDIDAVVIASSTDSHVQIITESAAAGKHIFCEKPIATNLQTIDMLLHRVDNEGIKFMVGFNRRFDPTFKHVKELVVQGKIGDPHIINITSRDPAPPHLEYLKASGGIFFDCTIHDFDMARYLVGDEVVEIYATGSVLVDPVIGTLGDLDTTMITLKFRNGAVGSINNSRRAVYGYDQRIEVFGSKGCAIAYNETPTQVAIFDENGTHTDKPLYFNNERYPESFLREMAAFVDCVKNDKTPLVTGLDGRIPVVMAMAARKSFEENRPIKIETIQS